MANCNLNIECERLIKIVGRSFSTTEHSLLNITFPLRFPPRTLLDRQRPTLAHDLDQIVSPPTGRPSLAATSSSWSSPESVHSPAVSGLRCGLPIGYFNLSIL
ncbi:hypothetical protein EVAR_102510_1 [Eumeta japonica]|uniref:Uncharacterized protein n=1 Tax=Eumeta variegata TaxID=151549 RepID=A0A4C1ZT54_EUMVA|nr:hypothetical protein EVAR_102510_1 [Eumeta japonica]